MKTGGGADTSPQPHSLASQCSAHTPPSHLAVRGPEQGRLHRQLFAARQRSSVVLLFMRGAMRLPRHMRVCVGLVDVQGHALLVIVQLVHVQRVIVELPVRTARRVRAAPSAMLMAVMVVGMMGVVRVACGCGVLHMLVRCTHSSMLVLGVGLRWLRNRCVAPAGRSGLAVICAPVKASIMLLIVAAQARRRRCMAGAEAMMRLRQAGGQAALAALLLLLLLVGLRLLHLPAGPVEKGQVSGTACAAAVPPTICALMPVQPLPGAYHALHAYALGPSQLTAGCAEQAV